MVGSREFFRLTTAALLALAAMTGTSKADEVILTNGNKLTGKVGLISGGVMHFDSPVLGDMNIKLENVKSYSTDAPATLRLPDRHFVTGSTIANGTDQQITLANGQTYPAREVVRVNPPGVAWTGSMVASGTLTRGNSNNEGFGFGADATLRRDTPDIDDRFDIGALYTFSRTGRGAGAFDTADNLSAHVDYDLFFTDKFYGVASLGYFHDRIAALNYRLTPAVGVGYQWIEQKSLNFNTEASVAYLYEDYSSRPIEQDTAFRLAYHLKSNLNEQIAVFNDAEYVAPFRFGHTNHYVLAADAGIRATLTKGFFTEFKVVYQRNDFPARGHLKDDLFYLLGAGWQF